MTYFWHEFDMTLKAYLQDRGKEAKDEENLRNTFEKLFELTCKVSSIGYRISDGHFANVVVSLEKDDTTVRKLALIDLDLSRYDAKIYADLQKEWAGHFMNRHVMWCPPKIPT